MAPEPSATAGHLRPMAAVLRRERHLRYEGGKEIRAVVVSATDALRCFGVGPDRTLGRRLARRSVWALGTVELTTPTAARPEVVIDDEGRIAFGDRVEPWWARRGVRLVTGPGDLVVPSGVLEILGREFRRTLDRLAVPPRERTDATVLFKADIDAPVLVCTGGAGDGVDVADFLADLIRARVGREAGRPA